MPRLIESLRKQAQKTAAALGHDMSRFTLGEDHHAFCFVCGGMLYADPAASDTRCLPDDRLRELRASATRCTANGWRC